MRKNDKIAILLLSNSKNIDLNNIVNEYINILDHSKIMDIDYLVYEIKVFLKYFNLIIEYIKKSDLDITEWEIKEAPYKTYSFYNRKKNLNFYLVVSSDDKVNPYYIDKNFNMNRAKSIQEALRNDNTTQEVNFKDIEKKTIAYDYLFNYFGKDTFKGRVITGASIQIAIKAYKDEKEVKFNDLPFDCIKASNHYLNENYSVSFDKDKLYIIEKNMLIDTLFRFIYGWDKIDYEIIGFSLDYLDELPDYVAENLPDELKGYPYSVPMKVTKEEFEEFLKDHIKDFNISDNINAQVPSYSLI